MSKNRFDQDFAFKQEISFGNVLCLTASPERRTVESKKILDKYNGRIPVIIEKAETETTLQNLEQTK